MGMKKNNPGCDCCGCTEAPSCTLTGSPSGNDVTLSWTVTGVAITSAIITDELGNSWTLTVPPTSGTLEVTGGRCRSYTLTVINDCGSSPCTYAETPATCVCQTCTYTSGGTYTRRFPASTCIPCGCQRGKGTQLIVVISGVSSFYSTNITCSYTSGSCTEYPASPYASTCYQEYAGFDILNGTYVFTLSDAPCDTCGRFACTIDPSYFILGTATVKDVSNPNCDSIFSGANTTVNYTVELAVKAFDITMPTASSPPTTGASVLCYTTDGSGSGITNRRCVPVWRRKTPTLGSWSNFTFGDTATPDDTCGWKRTAKAYGRAVIGTCCSDQTADWPTLFGHQGFGAANSGAVMYYSNIETSVTTLG